MQLLTKSFSVLPATWQTQRNQLWQILLQRRVTKLHFIMPATCRLCECVFVAASTVWFMSPIRTSAFGRPACSSLAHSIWFVTHTPRKQRCKSVFVAVCVCTFGLCHILILCRPAKAFSDSNIQHCMDTTEIGWASDFKCNPSIDRRFSRATNHWLSIHCLIVRFYVI